jgi:hypothetical protein
MPWVPVSGLPNLDVREPIEGGIFALIPPDDERVCVLKREHPAFRAFMERFTDTFGQRIDPGVLLRWDEEGAPELLRTAEAAASFRDLLAASVVPRQRSLDVIRDRSGRILFADYFWLYPWMTDRNFEHLTAATPGMLAIRDPQQFRGQHSPDLVRMPIQRRDFDEPMLRALIEQWSERYSVEQPTWENTALFRSLNMAFHAMLFPGGSVTTYHDAGRIIGLWVAAFEILIHTGDGRVGFRDVFAHLEAVAWENRECVAQVHDVGTPERPSRRNVACWIYKHLYDCRNDFFHGNPVGPENLMLPGSGRPLFTLAATPYRAALARHIDLIWNRQIPSRGDAEAFAKYIDDQISFMTPQREIETALLMSRIPEAQVRAERDRIIAEHRARRRRGSP